MARFNPLRFPPGYFDLPADAGHTLPLDIIAAWTRSPQTREFAHELLGPFTMRGIVVSSDTAGLTRLTQERSLIEILAMVSRPKELLHAYGKAVGGIAVGTWAADNSQMFYADGIPPGDVLGMLLTLQDRIAAECEVGIGICAHAGEFYELGNAIYGPDADLVEGVAEDETTAGELVITEAVRHRLAQDSALQLTPRGDLREKFGGIWRVVQGPRLGNIIATDFRYPLPFTEEFYTGLGKFQRTRRSSIVPRPAFRESTVVVIDREREDRDEPDVAALNNLALAAAVRRLGGELVLDLAGQEIKTTGQVSIYLFDDAGHALAFARKLRAELASQRVELRIGMDSGRVLLFELAPETFDIAGSPVNLASKLAQDTGRFGAIHLTRSAARQAGIPDSVPVSIVQVGGVAIEVVVV